MMVKERKGGENRGRDISNAKNYLKKSNKTIFAVNTELGLKIKQKNSKMDRILYFRHTAFMCG